MCFNSFIFIVFNVCNVLNKKEDGLLDEIEDCSRVKLVSLQYFLIFFQYFLNLFPFSIAEIFSYDTDSLIENKGTRGCCLLAVQHARTL